MYDEKIEQQDPVANRPFPYYPPKPSEEQLVRQHLLDQLNFWDNNDPLIAKRLAQMLVETIQRQFDLLEYEIHSIPPCIPPTSTPASGS